MYHHSTFRAETLKCEVYGEFSLHACTTFIVE